MLDVRWLVENPERIRENLRRRHSDLDLTPTLQLYEQHKSLLQRVEQLKAERNRASQEIGRLKALKQDTTEAQEAPRRMGEEIRELDQQIGQLEQSLHQQLLLIPNVLQAEVPEGKDSSENVEVRRVGEISGARFTVLRGAAAALDRALISFMLDTHTRQHGYLEILPPYLVTRESMIGTGQLPKFEEDAFKTAGDRELFLIPTAEVPVTNLHAQEMLSEDQLPISYVAFTPCFRAEAGSYGQDVRGLIRQHQFHKVELVKFSHPDRSTEAHEQLTGNAEEILKQLELPYRTMLLCAGDIGFGSARTYDLEVWLPAQKTYREISSCSNFEEFQARRANIRFRPSGGGKPRYVHTLNGSGLAVGRTLVAILENYQEADGSVRVPKVLQPYLGTDRIIA